MGFRTCRSLIRCGSAKISKRSLLLISRPRPRPARFISKPAQYCDSINDRVSKILFEELAADEEGHIDFLETQQTLIAQIGLPLYAQKHIGGLEAIAPEKD